MRMRIRLLVTLGALTSALGAQELPVYSLGEMRA
jgi:hypothetical protein